MAFASHAVTGVEQSWATAPLDLVVPIITPDLTRASIAAAENLARGLNARIRLVLVHIVPFPLDIDHPPVVLEFVRNRLNAFSPSLSITRELRLGRDFKSSLRGALITDSVVLVASKTHVTNRQRTPCCRSAARRIRRDSDFSKV